MSNLPFIQFPKPETFKRQSGKQRPPGFSIRKPGREAQAKRLGSRFDKLGSRLSTPEGLAELRSDPGSIAPERAVVFELAGGDPARAYSALRNIPGFELLGEDEETAPAEHGFAVVKKDEPTDNPIRYRLYFAMPSVEALKVLVSVWERYDRAEPFGRKETPKLTAWRDLFEHLSDVRPWGPEDRLPEETINAWTEDLREFPDELHRIEVELWFRQNPTSRAAASKLLKKRLSEAGGRDIIEREIPEILYHAVLAEVPASKLRELMTDPADGLSAVDEVMFFRPQALGRVGLAALQPVPAYGAVSLEEPVQERSIVALFDGMPLTQHVAVTGRVRLEDPDNLAARYGDAGEQQHGTAMASIILNGDGHARTPVPHLLYVRPVLVPDGQAERFPDSDLSVYVMYEAVQRMLVGVVSPEGKVLIEPSAPDVRIVNISLGDEKRRFAGVVSPWARLLDYFSFVHRLLIIVSAGNIADTLDVAGVKGFTELEDMQASDRTTRMLGAVFSARSQRRLLSPAEAINVVTVGARHADELALDGKGAGSIDPYHLNDLPNISSALGTGAVRTPKPEILMNGGRELVRLHSSGDTVRVGPVDQPGRYFGIGSATPGLSGELDRMRNISGTSPAAALATHEALRIEHSLRTMDGVDVPDQYLAVVLKALLAHGAAWNVDVAAIIGKQADEAGYKAWQHVRAEKCRFLGLGVPVVGRVLGCTGQRALLLGFGEIECDKTDPHLMPLPKELSAKNEWRALTATLSWLTPIHIRHGAYRRAALDLDAVGFSDDMPIGVEKDQEQPDDALAGRGTLIHRRWSGTDPAVFVDDQGIQFNVSCRSPTKGLDDKVPYALAVTLEVGAASQIGVYTEIRDRVRSGAPIVIRTGG